MKILYYASIDFYSNPNPSFHLMNTMIQDLLQEGIGVNLVGCKEDGVDQHIPLQIEDSDLFSYMLIKRKKVNKRAFAKRYLEGIVYSINSIKCLKKMVVDTDAIFIQSSPTALYSILAAKIVAKNRPVIYNIQDMFPGSSIASGVMPQKWMQHIFYSLQKVAYKKSDIIIVISEDMKMKVIEQGVEEEKVEVILNWFDDKSVSEIPWKKNRFVHKNDMMTHKFYVQYAGTMGYVFDYKMVLDVAEKLKDNSDIVFQMVGDGSQKKAFVSEAKERGLSNIVFLPFEPQEMVSDVYSACSVCLIPLKKGVIGNSVPSKAGLLMACKRPIITSADINSEYARMINENKIGFAFENDDVEGIANGILYLNQNREKCIAMGQAGYEYGHELYSRSNNMKKYIDTFRKIEKNGVC